MNIEFLIPKLLARFPRGNSFVRGIVVVSISVFAAGAVRYGLDPLLEERAPFVIFFLPILASAILVGKWAGIAATIGSCVVGGLFFLTPGFSFAGLSPTAQAQVILFLVEGGIISWMGGRLRYLMEQRTELYERERHARAEAESASRFKDQFLATLSHELRSPLNAILGWTQILRNKKERTSAEIDDALDIIERNARTQARLVSDLLDMSRVASGKLTLNIEPVNLQDLVLAEVESFEPATAAKEIEVVTHLEDNLPFFNGDPSRLRQILWNLLSNAVKFTPKGGTIVLDMWRSNNEIIITVTDNGIGIRPEVVPHLFERYRQGDLEAQRKHGLGLGLSIVKHLTEAHGGQVTVESRGEGKGTCFTLNFPSPTLNPPKGKEPIANSESGKRLQGMRIVVVDDSNDDRVLLNRILSDAGAVVSSADSGDTALKAIDDSPPDLVISDIGMPNGDGYELIRKVRSRTTESHHRIPAIALTAYDRPEDKARSFQEGFDYHVAKPFVAHQLVALIEKLAVQ